MDQPKCACVVLLLLALGVCGGDVLSLDTQSFGTVVDGSRAVLVMFYAPWCGHCKILRPAWKTLAETYHGTDLVAIATVDADVEESLAERFSVRGFPTIMFFPTDHPVDQPVKYMGGRAVQDFIRYINDQTGLRRSLSPTPSLLGSLKGSTFEQSLERVPAALVKFFVPWCEHCQALLPAYEQVATTFQKEDGVIVVRVDCDAERVLCKQQGITSYPMLRFYRHGSAGQPYEGGRSAGEMVQALNEYAGVQRVLGGGLGPRAARVDTLDTIVDGFVRMDQESQLEALSLLQQSDDPAADYYVNLVQLVLQKGNSWPRQEVDRLERLLVDPAIDSDRMDKFVIRRNVLTALL